MKKTQEQLLEAAESAYWVLSELEMHLTRPELRKALKGLALAIKKAELEWKSSSER